jgi:membrane-bound ClpP family serine protease
LLLTSLALLFAPLAWAQPESPSTVAATRDAAGSSGASQAITPSVAVPAARQASNVAIITIRGEIDKTTARSVQRRIQLAQRAGAGAIVFELDTPGGEVGAVLKITEQIKLSQIPNTVSWINTQAYSGGAIIALATREIVTNQQIKFGDAIPIQIAPGMGLRPLGQNERQKVLAPLVADLIESARLRGYDEKLVQGLVSLGVELWLIENPTTGQRLFVGREEYTMLFGEPSAGEIPRVMSADTGYTPMNQRPKQTDAKRTSEATNPGGAPKQSEGSIDGQIEGGNAGELPGIPPNTPSHPGSVEGDERTKIIPAAPEVAVAAAEASKDNRLNLPPSTRPMLTAQDRGQWKVIEKVSDGQGPLVFNGDDLLRYRLASQTIRTDEELKAYFGAKYLLSLDQTWSESLVGILTSFYVRGALLAIFLIASFITLTHPGLVVPEGLALLSLAALLMPPLLINMANWWEVAAILAGIVLIAAEIFVFPGFGVPGAIGLLLFFGGLIGTFLPPGGAFPDTPGERSDLLYSFVAVMMGLTTAGFAIYFISKNFGSLPMFNKLVLKDGVIDPFNPATSDDPLSAMAVPDDFRVGEAGRTISPLRPSGRIELGDRIVEAVAGLGFIEAGVPVRVVKVTPTHIVVERDPTPQAPADGGPSRSHA